MSKEMKLYEVAVHAVGPDGRIFNNVTVVTERDLEELSQEILQGLTSWIQMKVGIYGTWWGSKRECKPPIWHAEYDKTEAGANGSYE